MDFNMTQDLIHVGHFCRQHSILIQTLDIRLKDLVDKKEYVMLKRIGADLLDHCYVQLDSMIERMALWFTHHPDHDAPSSENFAGKTRQSRPPHERPSFSPSTVRSVKTNSTVNNRIPGVPAPKPLISVPFVSQRKRTYQFDMMYWGGPTLITPSLNTSQCKIVMDIYKSRVWDGRVPNYAGLEYQQDLDRFSSIESDIIRTDFPDWNTTFQGDALECMYLNRSYILPPVRSKREYEMLPTPQPFFFTLLAGLVGGIVAAISGSYVVEQLTDISDNSDQAENIQVLQSHQTRMQIDDRSIRILNTTMTRVLELVKQQSAEISAIETLLHLGYTASGLYDEINRLTRAWNALAMHRITPDVFRAHTLVESLDKIENFLTPRGFAIGIKQTSDLFTCECSSLIFESGFVRTIIHIPTFKVGSQMKLLEMRSLPIHFDSGKDQNSIYFWPDMETNYLAVSDDDRTFRTFSEGELSSCNQIADLYFCDSNIVRLKPESSCLVALYKQDLKLIKDKCKWKIQPADDHAEHIGLNLYALYQSSKGQIDLFCPSKPELNCAMSVSGLVKFEVKEGCTVRSRSFLFESGIGVTIKSDAYRIRNFSMNEVMQQQLIHEENEMMHPTELQDAIDGLGLVGKTQGLTIKNIKALYSSSKRSTHWTWGLGTFAMLGLLIGLLLLLVKVWRCTSRSSAGHMRRDIDDLRTDIVRRGDDLQQQQQELINLTEGLNRRRREDEHVDARSQP